MAKEKVNKVSFKKHPKPTGLARIGCGFYTDIRLNGKKCGTISGGFPRNPNINIQICLVKNEKFDDGNPNCSWAWLYLKNDCKTEDEARIFAEEKLLLIAKDPQYTLNFFEKE